MAKFLALKCLLGKPRPRGGDGPAGVRPLTRPEPVVRFRSLASHGGGVTPDVANLSRTVVLHVDVLKYWKWRVCKPDSSRFYHSAWVHVGFEMSIDLTGGTSFLCLSASSSASMAAISCSLPPTSFENSDPWSSVFRFSS